jgi:hypothetical protein
VCFPLCMNKKLGYWFFIVSKSHCAFHRKQRHILEQWSRGCKHDEDEWGFYNHISLFMEMVEIVSLWVLQIRGRVICPTIMIILFQFYELSVGSRFHWCQRNNVLSYDVKGLMSKEQCIVIWCQRIDVKGTMYCHSILMKYVLSLL